MTVKGERFGDGEGKKGREQNAEYTGKAKADIQSDQRGERMDAKLFADDVRFCYLADQRDGKCDTENGKRTGGVAGNKEYDCPRNENDTHADCGKNIKSCGDQ